jgi:leucine dehydrogenase
MLEQKGIIYAPDYVINAGGVINVADELYGYNRDRAMKRVETIYDNMLKVFEIAKRDGIPSYKAADRMAEERIAAMRKTRSTFLVNGQSILSHR